jgi:class 3 adenylate cyclase
MPNLPSGTVTFLFSDIEGSTSLLKQLGDDGYPALLAIHRRLIRETFALYDGQEIDTQGDASSIRSRGPGERSPLPSRCSAPMSRRRGRRA